MSKQKIYSLVEAMARKRVGVLEDINAQGLVPLAVSMGYGKIVRVKKVLEIRQEGTRGTVYRCRTPDGELVVRRAYETGYWFLDD